MGRWKNNIKKFKMSVHYRNNKDGSTTASCRIPRPIIEYLKHPNRVEFILKNNGDVIIVKTGIKK